MSTAPWRDVTRLDVERTETELGAGWVTGLEQTALDLAARPDLGGIDAPTSHEAIRALMLRADRPPPAKDCLDLVRTGYAAALGWD